MSKLEAAMSQETWRDSFGIKRNLIKIGLKIRELLAIIYIHTSYAYRGQLTLTLFKIVDVT